MATGFEIAGIVLGAFPLAIAALEKYRHVAERVNLFYNIRLEHKKCLDTLEHQQFLFKSNLFAIILPLEVIDESKVHDLLSDPGGAGWKDIAIAEKLKDRLQDSYSLYLRYIQGMQQTMKNLNRELAVDESVVQRQLRQPSANRARPGPIESTQYLIYRIKFSNGKSVRQTFFDELQDYNANLKELRKASDENAQLLEKYADARMRMADLTICKFWVEAARVFRALAAAWTCQCRQQHHAKLQLEHRTTTTPDFTILFETSGLGPLLWDKRRATVSKGPGQITPQLETRTVVSHHMFPGSLPSPANRTSPSPLVTPNGSRKPTRSIGPLVPSSEPLTWVQRAAQMGDNGQITSLCSSLEKLRQDCCGYLSHDECRYYICAGVAESHGWQRYCTLEETLKEPLLRPTIGQRYAIALIAASSFLQFLQTPWMPGSLSKSDIIFFQSTPVGLKGRGAFDFHRPHMTRHFVNAGGEADSSSNTSVGRSLNQLGILLLELHFGAVLEDQECRKRYGDGAKADHRNAFDVMAARDWWEQAGQEENKEEFALVSGAIAWCLQGCRSTNNARGEWRHDMFKEVIQPLLDCRDHLKAGDRDGV